MPRNFLQTLGDIRGGAALEELGAKLCELVSAVQSTGGSGTLTLTLGVRSVRGQADTVVVTDDIRLRAPELRPAGTLMYPTSSGQLRRDKERRPAVSRLSERRAAAGGAERVS